MILAAILPKVAILVQTVSMTKWAIFGKILVYFYFNIWSHWSVGTWPTSWNGVLFQPSHCDHQWLIPKIDRTEVKVVFKRTSYRRLSHCTVTLEALAQLYQWRDPVGHDSWWLHNGHPSPSPVFYFCNKFYFCKNKISVLSLRKNKLRWNVWGS